MAHELITFLKEQGLDALVEKYTINIKRHNEFSNIVLLKYDQLSSPMGEKIVQQCRGIIIDTADDFRVVNYTFSKFFNHSEGHAAKIDWSSARIYAKLDGSLCQLYYYNGEWRVATSGTPDAGGNVGDFEFTFAELFWKVWGELGYQLPTDTNISFSFELCTPYNTIVVQHTESSITLIGARRLSDFQELNPVVEAHHNKWKCVKIFPLENYDEVEQLLEQMNGSDQEGFVVCDSQYRRVKLKCVDYVNKHRLVSSMSVRNMLNVIRTNEGDEVLSYCPQFKDLYYEIKCKYEYTVGHIEGFYKAIKNIDDIKPFAMIAKDQYFSGVLFGLRHNKVSSVRESLANMNIRQLESWLEN